jgi:glycosyltransferase involved in cell wall biosynthesis
MKRIIHITEPFAGGVAHAISQLAKRQAADGFEVIIAHSTRPDTLPEDELAKLFPVVVERMTVRMADKISPLRDFLAMLRLVALLRQVQPDVIHLHSSKAGILGRIAAKLTGFDNRVFYTPHGFSFLRQDVSKTKRKLFCLFEKAGALMGGTLLACSPSEAKLARELVGHKRVVLVENSIDLADVCSSLGSTSGTVKIVTAGRICYPKAPWRFRDIAASFPKEKAVFQWIGDGELRAELFADGRLPDNLTISGWRDRTAVLDELFHADIFLMPSLWEGMPLALIEAQASGLPAVVSDAGGCKDVVIDGVTGFVCDSVEEMTRKVDLLIRDTNLRNRMGSEARRLATERFSSERMHREVLDAYREAEDGAPQGRSVEADPGKKGRRMNG